MQIPNKAPDQSIESYEDRFHRIHASIPCGVYEYYLALDGESHFIYFNDRLLEILEIEREDLGKDASLIWKYIHPDDVGRLAAEDLRTRETGEKFFIELRVIAASGLVKWVQVSSQQTNKMVEGVYTRSGYILDVTEKKQQEAKLTALSLTIPDLLLIIDEDGRYIEINQSKYLALFFPDYPSIIGKTFNDIFSAEVAQNFYAFIQQVLGSNESISIEYPLTAKDGTVYHFESRSIAMQELINGKRATVSAIRDITARKLAEQESIERGIELSLANKKLVKLEELEKVNQELSKALFEKNQLLKSMATSAKATSMGNLVSALAHEINNPLGAMSVNTQNLQMEIKELGELAPINQKLRLEELIQRIAKDNTRAAEVVTRLRKLFLRGEIQFTTVNLSEVLREVHQIIHGQIASNQIVLDMQIDQMLQVSGDMGQIQMVFLNAIQNAIDSLKDQAGVRKIFIKLIKNGDEICFEIIDSGSGFSQEMLSRGFELFHTSKSSGMGVGLWLSRAIMENHNGSLSIANHADGGAILRAYFYTA
jgi:PAS domain S-box-containing protein